MTKKKRYTQKALIRELSLHEWERTSGGNHQVKMVKAGKGLGPVLPTSLTMA